MRLPLAAPLISRDGTLEKDSLVTNGIIEGDKKSSVVRLRPGLVDLGLIATGTARLLACWNGLLSIIGSSLSSLVITTNSGSGSSVIDTVDSSGDTIFVGAVARFGSKFIVSMFDEDIEETVHYYGNHTAGFTSLTSPAVPSPSYAIKNTASNGSVVVATGYDYTGGAGTESFAYRIWSSSVGATPSFTQRLSVTGWFFWSVHYIGGKFVVCATNSPSSSRVYWSTDGVTWNYYQFPSGYLRCAVYDGAYWWFYGNELESSSAPIAYKTNDFSTFSAVTLTGLGAATFIAYAVHTAEGFRVPSFISVDGSSFSADTIAAISLDYNEDFVWAIVPASGANSSLYDLTTSPTLVLTQDFTNTFSYLAGDGAFGSFCLTSASAVDVATVTWSAAGETVTPSSIGTLVDALMSAEATGSAQSQQELLLKSSERLWQYTETGGLVEVTDIDYPGHHTYTASSVTRSGSVATFNTTVTNALESGMSVVVAGAAQTEYNGTHEIASIVDGDTFTYAVSGTPATPATGTITVYGGKTTVPGIVFLDGYFFVMTDKGVIHNSALGDGTSWNALDFITAAEEPGDGVALAKTANYLIAFKEWSTEPFYDAGNATGSPLAPVKSASLLVGCASGESVADIDGKLFWISQTKDKGRSVYTMQGLQQLAPVATPDVERVLANDDLASVSAYGIRIAGHVLYILTLHTSDVTLVFDATAGIWTQWTSLTADTPLSVTSMTRSGTTVTAVTSTAHGCADGDPVLFAGADQTDYNGRFNIQVINATTISFEVASSQATTATGTITATTYTEGHFALTKHVYCTGRNLLLHESNGHLYEIVDSETSDATAPIDLRCRTGKIDGGVVTPKNLASLDVVGHKTVNGLALVRWTDDDYASWSAFRRVDLEAERSQLRRCGNFSRRAFELRYTGDAKVTLGALELELKGK